MLAYIRNLVVAKKGDDTGASAVEYGLLVAAIAAIIILVVFALGGFVKGAFQDTCNAFEGSGQVNTAGESCTPE
jgi:pilus assembly protein Flp/PilA